MSVIGSFMNVMQLRQRTVSHLVWSYDYETLTFFVRDDETGLMLAYVTLDTVMNTIFEPDELLSDWIQRVSDHCKPSEAE